MYPKQQFPVVVKISRSKDAALPHLTPHAKAKAVRPRELAFLKHNFPEVASEMIAPAQTATHSTIWRTTSIRYVGLTVGIKEIARTVSTGAVEATEDIRVAVAVGSGWQTG